MHDQQVVPVGRLAGDLRRSDRAACPGQVLDDELSAKILAQSLRRDARDHVTWAARRIGHHHCHRPAAGIVLRPRRDGEKPDRSCDRIANFKQAFPQLSSLHLIVLERRPMSNAAMPSNERYRERTRFSSLMSRFSAKPEFGRVRVLKAALCVTANSDCQCPLWIKSGKFVSNAHSK